MTSKTVAQKPDMLNALTSFRFLAALMVFAWHTHIMSGVLDKYQLGYVGVGFFYLLSGFILAYVYSHKLASGSARAIKKFYIARIAKIYPTHVLTLIAAIPLSIGAMQAWFPVHTKWHFLQLLGVNLTLTQSYFPTNMINFSFNGVAWSISVEMLFYILFPLIIYLLARYASKMSLIRLGFLAALVWLVLIVSLAPIPSFVDDWKLYIFPLVRLPEFIVGVILGMIYVKQQSTGGKWIASKKRATLLETASLGALAAGILASPYVPQSLHFAAWLLPFLAVVIFIFSQQCGFLSNVLSHKLLVYLGEISFSFYMVHQLVIRYIVLLALPKLVMIVTSLLVSVAISVLMYHYYEEPMRVRLKKTLEAIFVYRRRLIGLRAGESALQSAESIDIT